MSRSSLYNTCLSVAKIQKKCGSEYRVLAINETEVHKDYPLNDNDLLPVFSHDDCEDEYGCSYSYSHAVFLSGIIYVTKNNREAIDKDKELQDYTFRGNAKIQTKKPLTGKFELVIYQDVKSLDFYARPISEFLDGRFVKVDENKRLTQ